MPPIASEDADPQDVRATCIPIISGTSAAAVQVLLRLLAANLQLKRDFWVDPIAVRPPFIVQLNPDLPAATLETLRTVLSAIPDVVMGSL